jgi:hypothetical protein
VLRCTFKFQAAQLVERDAIASGRLRCRLGVRTAAPESPECPMHGHSSIFDTLKIQRLYD